MEAPVLARGESLPSGSRGAATVFRLALYLALAALAWFAWMLQRDAEAADYAVVDLSRARLLAGASWSDPRWDAEAAHVLASASAAESPRRMRVEDATTFERVARDLERLSFVAEVGEIEVLWPDGLKVPLRLRQPVACVDLAGQFQSVDATGILLSGRWPAPPERAGAPLPVILCDARELARARTGLVLWSEAARDALAVAESLYEHLDASARARLGRIVIDARDARRASVEIAGVVLLLPHGRRVLFGRAPNTGEPGELPAAMKWASVARALFLLDPSSAEALDWELVDVRWDRPEILPRGARERGGPRAEVPDSLGD